MDNAPNSNRPLHDIQLSMAKEIRRICRANHIKYFIIAGTLLGAVRHRGFIPWDDDMDFGMMREDYDKFLECAASELPSDLFLQTWHSDEGFGLPMAKVRKSGTRFIEANSQNARENKGIFVDIFHFDRVPSSRLQRAWHNCTTYFLKRILLIRLSYSVGQGKSLPMRILLRGITRIARVIPTRKIVERLERQMKRYNQAKEGDLVTIGGSYGYSKETLKKSWTDELTEVEFEGSRWPAFALWQEYLEHMYGNYMQLPPAKERGDRHRVLEIDLGQPQE